MFPKPEERRPPTSGGSRKADGIRFGSPPGVTFAVRGQRAPLPRDRPLEGHAVRVAKASGGEASAGRWKPATW